ncbi:MAG TPA: 3-oxoacyl-[acyl-carrier-protein] reductase [Caulobacteraceae bacterium]|nr:3-oxoacyl-[acyl-carrier-protein] reductase [Caulobacteraceae bacterium]
MFDLSGKTALVTGASGGIGGPIARALHAQGAAVVLSGTRQAALDALAGELGERGKSLTRDLNDAASVDGLIVAAEALGAPIDILVANAGVTRDNLLVRMKDEEWEDVLRVNLDAYFRLSRAALRGMMRRRWGRIIGITSIVGVMGNAGQANYAASKAGMIGFTKSLAQEVAARSITINCVAPGMIVSPMTDALTDQQKQAIMSRIPAGHLGVGDDIAAACVYLASEEAAYVTGQTLHVNGGMAMV